MIYEAPEAKIICFAPVEKIARDWNWSIEEDPLSGGTSEFDLTLPGANPEGDA